MRVSSEAPLVMAFMLILTSDENGSKLTSFQGVNGDIFANQDENAWYEQGVKLIKDNVKVKPNTDTAKSAVLFLGDGMGISTVTAARIFDGQQKNMEYGEENVLSWEVFPWTALVKTYTVDMQGTDSASSATAFLNGIKTNGGVVGVDETVRRGYCETLTEKSKVVSILTLAERAGMSTGVVTTTRATHATPASSYAHSVDRGWESDKDLNSKVKDDGSNCKDIATQLVEYSHGNGIEVVFAGGRREFMHKNQSDPEYPDKKGDRQDNKDLIKQWLEKYPGSHYVWNKTAFDKIDPNKVNRVLGLFEPSHMQYESDRTASDTLGEPSIAEMTEKAIKILQKNPKGYFLLVEGGRIDHAHHDGSAYNALHEAVAFNKAVQTANDIVQKDDTLITVTADHSHVFTIGGYTKRGNPVLGVQVNVDGKEANDSFGKAYTALGYFDGPGGLNGSRPDMRGVKTDAKDFLQQATVLLDYESHASEDVGVYADGPGAYLFHGVVEQPYVFHVMDHALCLSESKQDTCDKQVSRGGPIPKSGGNSLSMPMAMFGLFIVAVRIFH
ncbi:alkaline phosphatase-like isoform X1 [Stylophora pistillata]|uniref:alkaline phosphatase n=1 Tax=Stylophora pistillata TaxID=50429 RepID=A0A2B4S0K5_STYPI|nr:alkaline phosphatase-like isoform X1 [Stylophora pistillata]PFX22946.1 Alkaline phosphatase, tissue-nonspecific isozyme [Stylophora pistillata]